MGDEFSRSVKVLRTIGGLATPSEPLTARGLRRRSLGTEIHALERTDARSFEAAIL